jgi:hypothetical protein
VRRGPKVLAVRARLEPRNRTSTLRKTRHYTLSKVKDISELRYSAFPTIRLTSMIPSGWIRSFEAAAVRKESSAVRSSFAMRILPGGSSRRGEGKRGARMPTRWC